MKSLEHNDMQHINRCLVTQAVITTQRRMINNVTEGITIKATRLIDDKCNSFFM